MATLEGIFVGDLDASDAISASEIKEEAPGAWGNLNWGPWDGKVDIYHIRYSPAIIFSGKVPAFDINFIDPMGDVTFNSPTYTYEEVVVDENGNSVSPIMNWADVKANYGAPDDLQVQKGGTGWWIFTGTTDKYFTTWTHNGKSYYFIINEKKSPLLSTIMSGTQSLIALQEVLKEIGGDSVLYGTLYEYKQTGVKQVTKTSTSSVIQPQIAKWYVALRTFALVGLLSVLVYIGIRIILSSGSAQNQAKYKNMLKDWLVAVCILFVLHYIMAFTLKITSTITDIFVGSAIGPGDEDIFVSEIRNKLSGEGNYWKYFGYLIMYMVLAIMTVTFTVEYLRRVIFIAFLTMIAPLIALTYPLDKIKDGQAQAFSTWIKEYIFNCLIQPVHLLLYTIFIGTASSLYSVNPVYAIVALAFFKPAEKFFRKMFGFDKATSLNTLGGVAGGALVMNAINKLKARGPKVSGGASGAGAGASSNPNSVRTATRNGVAMLPGQMNQGGRRFYTFL